LRVQPKTNHRQIGWCRHSCCATVLFVLIATGTKYCSFLFATHCSLPPFYAEPS
jgi:hypothetical protein